jgi:hypothetical protein
MRTTTIALTMMTAILASLPFAAAHAYQLRGDGTVCVQRPDGNCDVMSLEDAQAEEAARGGYPMDGGTVVIASPGGVSITRGYSYGVTVSDGISCEQGRHIAKRHVRALGYRNVRAADCDSVDYLYRATNYAGSVFVTVDRDGDVLSVQPAAY